MIKNIVNYEEGIYIEGKDIQMYAIKQGFDKNNQPFYALLAYPEPGAGYVLGKYNEVEEAKKWFADLANKVMNVELFSVHVIENCYIEPEVAAEPEVLEEVTDL